MWIFSLNLYLVFVWGVDVLVLCDFSEDEFIGIVLYVELIRLYNGLYYNSSLVHGVVLLESLQLLLINWPDVNIPGLFPVEFQMLLSLIGFIGLVADHTMHHIFLD